MAICGCSQQVRLTILRMRVVSRGCSLRTRRFTGFGLATFACLTLRYWTALDCVSATWTAPPPTIAQPAAQADNFARAIRTDISDTLVVPRDSPDARRRSDPFIWFKQHRECLEGNHVNRDSAVPKRESWLINCQGAGTVPKRDLREGRCKLPRRILHAGSVDCSESNSPPCGPVGGASPRCFQPASLRQRPRAVRATRPSWIR